MVLAQGELGELLRHTAGDIHPPFYYLLLHAWGRLAGWSEFAAAFLSLWFGVLLIALVYRATREWVGRSPPLQGGGVAVLAALLVALSPYNVWYSQEVRMYTLGAALGLLSVLFLRRLLARGGFFSLDFAAYVVVTALGLYTLYYFLFLIAFQWLYVLALLISRAGTGDSASRYLRFVLSQLAVALLYLPWLPTALRQAVEPPVPPWREFTPLPAVLVETLSALLFGQSVSPVIVLPLVALGALLVIGAATRPRWLGLPVRRSDPASPTVANVNGMLHRGSARGTAPQAAAPSSTVDWRRGIAASIVFLLSYTLIPLAAIFLLSLYKPLYHVRYIFTYSPGFYILVALGAVLLLDASRARTAAPPRLVAIRAAAAALAFLALTNYSLYNFWHSPEYAEDDLRGAVPYLAEAWRPGDAILVNAGYAYPALAYYWERAAGTDAAQAPVVEPLAGRVRLTEWPPAEPGSVGSSPPSSLPRGPLLLQTGTIDGAPNLGWGDPRSDFYATDAAATRAALDRVFAAHPRVWVFRIYDTVVDPGGVIRAYLDTRGQLFEDRPFPGEANMRVQGYLTGIPDDVPPGATRLNAILGERVELVGYQAGARERRPGEPFDVALYWRILPPGVNHNYQVSLQLLDANGQNVAQADETPLGADLPMTRWEQRRIYRQPLRLRLPLSLAPGEYRALVKLYDPRTLEVLGEIVWHDFTVAVR
jgi:hypothetical protein